MEEWTPANVGILIGGIGIVIVNIISSIFQGRKLTMIEAHVNSKATESAGEIKALRNEITSLIAQAAEKKEIAAVLAQVVSAKGGG